MNYKTGDVIDTTKGILIVQCPIGFNNNNHSKYNKLGNRVLYWLQTVEDKDVFYWDTELETILTDDEKLSNEEECYSIL